MQIDKRGYWFSLNYLFFPSFLMAHSLADQTVFFDTEPTESCEVVIDNDGVFDYASLPAREFKPNSPATLVATSRTLRINCYPAMSVRFSMNDQRFDSAPASSKTQFGLGFVNVNGKIGYYELRLSHPYVDLKSASLYQAQDENHIAPLMNSMSVTKNTFYSWALNETTKAVGNVYTVNIQVTPTLNALTETNGPIVNGTELDGQAELTFLFGL